MKLLKQSQLSHLTLCLALTLSTAAMPMNKRPFEGEEQEAKRFRSEDSSDEANDYTMLLGTLQKADGLSNLFLPNWDDLIEFCYQITSLTFFEKSITDGELVLVAQHCPGLTKLKLMYCQDSADDGLLYNFPVITDTSLQAFAQHCPGLTSLECINCPIRITKAGLGAIAENCADLIKLLFIDCPGITQAVHEAVLGIIHSTINPNQLRAFFTGSRQLNVDQQEDARLEIRAPYLETSAQLSLNDCPVIAHTDRLAFAHAHLYPTVAQHRSQDDPENDGIGALVAATEQLYLEQAQLEQGQDAYTMLLGALQKAEGLNNLSMVSNWDELIEFCYQITSLTFFTKNISNDELALVAQHCPALTDLYLHDCLAITDTGIQAFSGLIVLAFYNCPGITNAGLGAIAQNCPSLTELWLINCPSITDAGLWPIIQSCSCLITLKVAGYPSITPAFLAKVLAIVENTKNRTVELAAKNLSYLYR